MIPKGKYGASLWCDPYRWIPEAARLLRPSGRLIFMGESTLARMCLPETGPATERLARDLFGLHQVVRRGSSGTTYRQFTLPHGERIRLMTACGLVVEDLIEVQFPPGAANDDFPEYPDEWVRHWPAEEVWFAAAADRPAPMPASTPHKKTARRISAKQRAPTSTSLTTRTREPCQLI